MKLWLIVLLLSCVLWLPTFAQSESLETEIQELLEDSRDENSPAVSLFIWTPDGSYRAATGLVDLNTATLATPDDRFRLGSVSKTYVAVAALQLAENGLFNLDDPISLYLPEEITNNIANADTVTISQLLTMTSGMFEYLNDDFYTAVDKDPSHIWTPTEILTEYTYGEEAIFEPGTDFEYTNTNYLLLQLLIEQVTQQPLHEVIRANILEPTGAQNTYTQVVEELSNTFVHGYEDLDGDGSLDDAYAINDGAGMGDGGLVATAEDTAKFYQALFYDQILLNEDSIVKFLTDPLDNEYGMGIEIIKDEEFGLIYGHSGSVLGFTTDARYYADFDAVIILLHADDSIDTEVALDALSLILDEG